MFKTSGEKKKPRKNRKTTGAKSEKHKIRW